MNKIYISLFIMEKNKNKTKLFYSRRMSTVSVQSMYTACDLNIKSNLKTKPVDLSTKNSSLIPGMFHSLMDQIKGKRCIFTWDKQGRLERSQSLGHFLKQSGFQETGFGLVGSDEVQVSL